MDPMLGKALRYLNMIMNPHPVRGVDAIGDYMPLKWHALEQRRHSNFLRLSLSAAGTERVSRGDPAPCSFTRPFFPQAKTLPQGGLVAKVVLYLPP